jgi:hypothetical protein
VTADASADCTVQLDGTCVSSLPRLECGVYMAPSTLGEDTNLGIYTGKALRTDDVVNFPEIAIPLLFREWGEHVEGIADGTLWDRYIWEGEVADLETYTDRNRIDNRAVFVPGIGCTVNSVLDMNNIESTHGSTYDTAGLHRSRDPGTGAFSPYHNALTTAVTDIAPGAELFASYGDYWVPSIPGVQVTLDEVLDVTEDFLQNDLYEFVQSHRDADALTPDVKEALFAFVKDFPLPNQPFSNLPRNVPWADVERAIHEAGTHRKHTDTTTDNVSGESSVARQFIREQSIRDLAWLDEHGYCQDHLRPGRSTLPQAGRGAFATRNLPAGSVVGYAPLIHIGLHGREVLRITYPPSEHDHHVGNDDNDGENGTTPRTSYDLVLNYSFAHRNSTVILTPYGGMVNYINHGSTTSGRANVQVRWPDKSLIAHVPSWLEQDPIFLSETVEKIGLSFEYVALRDISEGEEVFMDYGPEWEQAWQTHVEQWQPVPDAERYQHTSEWKDLIGKDERGDSNMVLRTMEELESNPYPPNVVTMCRDSYRVTQAGTFEWLPVLRQGHERVYCNVLERKQYKSEADDSVANDESNPSVTLYVVAMQVGSARDDRVEERSDADEVGDADEWIVVERVPREEIFVYDRAFSADWHLPNVFRHPMMIPDYVMPLAWMNGPPKDAF